MSAPRKGPSAGSRAYLALVALHKAGGQADVDDFMKAASWVESAGQFERQVVKPLAHWRLVAVRGSMLVLTDSGLAFLGATGAVAVPELVITPATYVPPMRTLSACYRSPVRIVRDGAFDYRDIPSRHGDERVPFKSSLQVNHG